jgi:hypothetical protein
MRGDETTRYSENKRVRHWGLECPNLCRANPLRPAIQTRHDMECDCIALADASRSVQPSVSSPRGIPPVCFLWHYTGVSISVRILPRSSNNVGSVSLSTVFRPSNNIHSNAEGGISIPLLSRGYCDRLVKKNLFAENRELSCKRLFMFSDWRLFAGDVGIFQLNICPLADRWPPFEIEGQPVGHSKILAIIS